MISPLASREERASSDPRWRVSDGSRSDRLQGDRVRSAGATMNRTVPWSKDASAGQRPGRPEGDWLDEAAAQRSDRPGGRPDHTVEMKAIAAQLERLSGAFERDTSDPAATTPTPNRLDALRDAVAAIALRQADLDGEAGAPSETATPSAVGDAASAETASAPIASAEPSLAPSRAVLSEPPSRASASPGSAPPAVTPRVAAPIPKPWGAGAVRETSGLRRVGVDLSAEVSQTFARFSRDLQDAIQAADPRPQVEALGQEIRQIGRAVDGIGADRPSADALARIGEQTREMRDMLKASTVAPVPLDGLERQVASLETRLGRLASGPVPASAPPPGFDDTMAEVRALLEGFDPGAAMSALESRLGALTDRIERGLDARGPAGLIEGLSRQVEEIHASLRSQLAETAIDTRPLEGLVRGLSERIGQVRDATTDFHQLEAAVRDAAARIDDVTAGLDPRGLQAVETQLARLSDRLDRSEASLRSLDGVEHTLGELFSQFEVTRQVAIDAAETAARTAARDTLRAALQNPNLGHRASDVPTAAVDQMARSLDDIRSLQDTAERRTQSALSDIQIAMDRLAQQMAGASGRAAAAADEPRRARPEPAAATSRVVLDPADHIIEPGSGRGFPAQAARPDPRAEQEPAAAPSAPAVESDGPASFIAAARRAAQTAQASAASAAAVKAVERRTAPQATTPRPGSAAAASGAGALGRARLFLAQRRRPLLLGIAALVLLVGAFEVVRISADPGAATRVSDIAPPAHSRVATAATPVLDRSSPSKAADLPKPVLPPATPPAAAPLPTFVAGPPKAAPSDGIAEGLRTAAASGDAGAQYEIGLRYSEGRGVARDAKQSIAWFEKAAAQGSAPAAYRLGSAFEKGVGVDRDPGLAMSWYGKAADAGNIRAMHNLAVMSAEGAAGKPDYAKAAQWFGKASTYGVRDSQFNLAILYARGLGIEQSLPQSYTWFAIAAGEGDEDAAKKRDEVAGKLDAKALAAAKAAADAFHAATPTAAANEVAPPPGGWDAAAPHGSGMGATGGAKVSQL